MMPMLDVTRSMSLTMGERESSPPRRRGSHQLDPRLRGDDERHSLTFTMRQLSAPFHSTSKSRCDLCTRANHGYLFSREVFSAQSRPILRAAYCTSGSSSVMMLPAFL